MPTRLHPLFYLWVALYFIQPSNLAAQDTLRYFFKGTVNKEYPITMMVQQIGQQLKGAYFYDKYRKNIYVEGRVEAGETMVLYEVLAGGEAGGSVFRGTYAPDWSSIMGRWENSAKERRFNFELKAIKEPEGVYYQYRLDDIRRFQELLNYFENKPIFPFKVTGDLSKDAFRLEVTKTKDTKTKLQSVIPYRLARRYIMNKTRFDPEGAFDYFNLKSSNYKAHEFHYKALCRTYQTNCYVGLLINFSNDTGWDQYQVSCLLIFDYAGHLIDACKVGKQLDLESNGRQYMEEAYSTFRNNTTIEFTSKQQEIQHGQASNGTAYFNQAPIQEKIYYILQANGRFVRQEVDLGNSQKRKN